MTTLSAKIYKGHIDNILKMDEVTHHKYASKNYPNFNEIMEKGKASEKLLIEHGILDSEGVAIIGHLPKAKTQALDYLNTFM